MKHLRYGFRIEAKKVAKRISILGYTCYYFFTKYYKNNNENENTCSLIFNGYGYNSRAVKIF